jgi:hypothetical protein
LALAALVVLAHQMVTKEVLVQIPFFLPLHLLAAVVVVMAYRRIPVALHLMAFLAGLVVVAVVLIMHQLALEAQGIHHL